MLEELQFATTQDIKRMLDGLTQQEREELLAEQMKQLSPEAKLKLLGISESGLTVVTGSFVALNSEVAVNIQNTSGFDPEKLFSALAEYRKTQREKGT